MRICLANPRKPEILAESSQEGQRHASARKPLRIDDAEPFTTTPFHRIMIPSHDDDVTMKASDLQAGNWVMCSDGVAKKVREKREWLAAGLQKV